MSRLRFGIFLAPFHPAGENPTLALQRDLELIAHLDRLGYDEAWIGEHHSAGSEIIASPEIFIAAAAERTQPHQARHRRHLARLPQPAVGGRADGAARPPHARARHARRRPGLAADRLGDDRPRPDRHARAARGEPRHHHAAPARRGAGHRRDADAQADRRPAAPAALLRPHFDVAVAAVASPTGPRLAGRYGVGLLSIGATLTAAGFDALAHHWNVMEERAADVRHARSTATKWRLVGLMHIAETREQAYRDVEHGIEQWFRYFQKVAAFPQMAVEGGDVKRDDRLRQRRPASARSAPSRTPPRRSQRLVDQSRGLRRDAAARPRVGQPAGDAALLRADRPARHAGLPGPGRADAGRPSARATDTRAGYAEQQNQAVAHMTEKYQREVAGR